MMDVLPSRGPPVANSPFATDGAIRSAAAPQLQFRNSNAVVRPLIFLLLKKKRIRYCQSRSSAVFLTRVILCRTPESATLPNPVF
jgi:hypothetical protein